MLKVRPLFKMTNLILNWNVDGRNNNLKVPVIFTEEGLVIVVSVVWILCTLAAIHS